MKHGLIFWLYLYIQITVRVSVILINSTQFVYSPWLSLCLLTLQALVIDETSGCSSRLTLPDARQVSPNPFANLNLVGSLGICAVNLGGKCSFRGIASLRCPTVIVSTRETCPQAEIILNSLVLIMIPLLRFYYLGTLRISPIVFRHFNEVVGLCDKGC